MPSMLLTLSITKDFAMREVIRQNNQWQDILKKQTELKKNYSTKTLQATQKVNQKNKKQEEINQQQHSVEKISNNSNHNQQPQHENLFEPAYKIKNIFSIGLQTGDLTNSCSVPNRNINCNLPINSLRFIRVNDNISAPINNWYVEGDIAFGYGTKGQVQENIYENSGATAYLSHSTIKSASLFNASIGFGYPINVFGDYNTALLQIIPLVGGYYNTQEYSINPYSQTYPIADTVNVHNTVNPSWYGAWAGIRTNIRIHNFAINTTIKYDQGHFYSKNGDLTESGSSNESSKASGIEARIDFVYPLLPKWKLVLTADAQRWQAKTGGSFILFTTVPQSNGQLKEAIWRTQYYMIGLQRKF